MLCTVVLMIITVWCSMAETRSKPRAIVHIGPSKTGSTSIQNGMDKIKPTEFEALGWYLLLLGGHQLHSGVTLVKAFEDYNNKVPGNFLQESIDNNHDILLSCEKLGTKDMKELKLYSPALEPSIILLPTET